MQLSSVQVGQALFGRRRHLAGEDLQWRLVVGVDDLAEYTKRYKLTDITEDVLSFKRPVSAQLVTKRLNTGVIQRTGPTVFRPGMVEVGMAEVGISAGSANSDGPRTVKLVVRNPSGPPVQPAAADSERKSARWDEMKISVSVLYWNL